uniref:acid phosphatase n=1 Tax=Setaria digitata TaxID=48799 RepID=A0A915PKU1_9BILA
MYIIQLIIAAAVVLSVTSDKLLLLQAIWRHGDRAPIKTCKGFPIKMQHWPQGKGELTTQGMAQHVKLGKIIYNRYVNSLKFLNSYYDSRQIYVRSTDVNRTLMSAVSNFVGFYNNPSESDRLGIDFPNITEWPHGFVAVPIHTVDNRTDYGVLKELEAVCKESLTFDDVWYCVDTFYCEKVHSFKIPVSDVLYDQLEQLYYVIENYKSGLDLQPYEGIDFKYEIGKIRGGSILWSMLRHFDLKLHCLKPENHRSSNCTWMKELKYYAYSAVSECFILQILKGSLQLGDTRHDTTLAALLCTLNAKQKILKENIYPEYSAAIFFELWNTTNGPRLKVYYHRNFTEEQLEDITELLDHCSENMDSDGFCDYEGFRNGGIVYYPGNKNKLCQDTKSKQTSFNPDEFETKATAKVVIGLTSFLSLLLQILAFWKSLLFSLKIRSS